MKKILKIMLLVIVFSLLIGHINFVQADDITYNKYNVVFVVDSSGSMKNNDKGNDRFEAITMFTDLIAEKGNRAGAVFFATNTAEVELMDISSNESKDKFNNAVQDLNIKGYSNIGLGLLKATEMLNKDKNDNRDSVIILLSDGNTNMKTTEEIQESLKNKAEAIEDARENDIKIYSVTLNTSKGKKGEADLSEMKQISNATKGQAEEVTKSGDLEDVYQMFYNMVYGSNPIRIKNSFTVPGFGIEDANIKINSNNIKKVALIQPDGKDFVPKIKRRKYYSFIKIKNPQSGTWKINIDTENGGTVESYLICNNNLSVETNNNIKNNQINTNNELNVSSYLKAGKIRAKSSNNYQGYKAKFILYDENDKKINEKNMDIINDHVETKLSPLSKGIYKYKVQFSSNYVNKESKIVEFSVVTPDVTDTAPIAKENPVEVIYNIYPFRKVNFVYDLKTLATDSDVGDKLRYKIINTSFVNGTDYTLSDDYILTMNHFSLSKGSYDIRAIDQYNKYCDITLKVKTVNIGLIALIGIGIAILIALAIFGFIAWRKAIAFFFGKITVESIVSDGYYDNNKEDTKTPGRGKFYLKYFNIDDVGLNYNKSYFQGTGGKSVILVLDHKIKYRGKEVKKITIRSGADIVVPIGENQLKVKFVSTLGNTRSRTRRRSNQRNRIRR